MSEHKPHYPGQIWHDASRYKSCCEPLDQRSQAEMAGLANYSLGTNTKLH